MVANSRFVDLADAVVLASVRLTRTLRALRRSADLSEPEISALVVVVYSNGIVARDLAAMEGVTAATISRLVATMEAKGLVRRTTDGRDGRVQWIKATPLGARRVRDGHARRIAPLAKLIAALPREKRETLEAAVVVLAEVIAALQAEPGA